MAAGLTGGAEQHNVSLVEVSPSTVIALKETSVDLVQQPLPAQAPGSLHR